MQQVLRFFYANDVRDGLSKELLHEVHTHRLVCLCVSACAKCIQLSQVSNALGSTELRAAASAALAKQGAKAPRAIESSEMV